MADVSLLKKSYDKRAFQGTVDTNFSQLAIGNTPPTASGTPNVPSVDEFFQYYQDLFFQIPKFGATNSHEYLVKTSGEYIGNVSNNDATIKALIQEVTALRQQNLEFQQSQIQQSLQQTQEALSTTISTING